MLWVVAAFRRFLRREGVLMRYQSFFACVLLAGVLALAGCVQVSGTRSFHANLTGLQEVPSVKTMGKGQADVTLDNASHIITWNLTYINLSSPAVAAHIHGPAMPGANAGVMVPLKVGANPITGSMYLNDAQIADLAAGKYYINVHTANNKGGEIRGQLLPVGK
jgi:CHRD domain